MQRNPGNEGSRTRFVAAGEALLRVVEFGSGPPLLLINGIGAPVETWATLARRLSRRHRVIMFDAPGTGRSTAPRRPLRMPELARVVVKLLDELAERRVDVLGYSWGGALAQQLARAAPERVRRLVLVSTTPGLGGQPPSLAAVLLMATPLYFLLGRRAALAAPTVYGGDASRSRAGREQLGRWLNEPPRLWGYGGQLYSISGWTSLPWLHRLVAPTLVIGGDDDPLVPLRNARLLANRIPDAQLAVVPGAGHLWLLERADRSAELIEKFLAD